MLALETSKIFIGDIQDSHWRPPRFSLETQILCFKPPIYIGELKIFI